MSTVVYQGLQSCLESQLVESRTLRLKLASPIPYISLSEFPLKSCVSDTNPNEFKEKVHSVESTKKTGSSFDTSLNSSNPDMGSWSFIQALSINSKNPNEKENSYVHPLVKQSSSTLSEKSLELCTENLGSETGTDIIENSLFSSSSLDNDIEKSPTKEQQPDFKARPCLVGKKASAPSFPPPLTTIRGSESYQFRPHREDGRLVIKAVKTPLKKSLFQAERSHGRLCLSFLNNNGPNSDLDESRNEENEVKSEDNEEEEFENEVSDEEEEEQEERDEEEEEEEEESDVLLLNEDMDGNDVDVEVRMGMGKFKRPSRCKEGRRGNNEGLLNLEPFWVATS